MQLQHAAKARLFIKNDAPGYEGKICFHERLVQAEIKFDLLPPPEPSNASYYMVCGTPDVNNNKLHIYCYSGEDSGREKEYMLTITPGSVTCVVCHSEKVCVFIRQCSQGHPECDIRYLGREDGWHRQTHTTMVKHEVILMYWFILKKMKGPGVESYVSVIQEYYNLSPLNNGGS